MGSLFRLPDDELLAPLLTSFPGREHQIRSLAALVHPDAASCRNIVLHGTEATGKSSITEHLLVRLGQSMKKTASETDPEGETETETRNGGGGLLHVVVNAAQCITARHLFERIVGAVADVLDQDERAGPGRGEAAPRRHRHRRCESLAQLSVALSTMLEEAAAGSARWRFVLVLDAVDRQREAPPTLVPGLARLSEI
ncbi:hypothetical protein E4U53_001368, partial [Claviceps sorghi]